MAEAVSGEVTQAGAGPSGRPLAQTSEAAFDAVAVPVFRFFMNRPQPAPPSPSPSPSSSPSPSPSTSPSPSPSGRPAAAAAPIQEKPRAATAPWVISPSAEAPHGRLCCADPLDPPLAAPARRASVVWNPERRRVERSAEDGVHDSTMEDDDGEAQPPLRRYCLPRQGPRARRCVLLHARPAAAAAPPRVHAAAAAAAPTATRRVTSRFNPPFLENLLSAVARRAAGRAWHGAAARGGGGGGRGVVAR